MKLLRLLRNSIELIAFTGFVLMTTLFVSIAESDTPGVEINVLNIELSGRESFYIPLYAAGTIIYSLLTIWERYNKYGKNFIISSIDNMRELVKKNIMSLLKLFVVTFFSLALYKVYLIAIGNDMQEATDIGLIISWALMILTSVALKICTKPEYI